MDKDNLVKKRERDDKTNSTDKNKNKNKDDDENKDNDNENNSVDVISDTDSEEYDFSKYQKNNPDKKLLTMPKKSKFRMRAHCNPLSDISISYPLSPREVDWSLHFPLQFNKPKSSVEDIYLNTFKHPITYTDCKEPCPTHLIPMDNKINLEKVNILDLGCGYGGLLFNLSDKIDKNSFALGMEIRDKVTNFVGEKIKTLIINTEYEKYTNIGAIRTNCMKLMLNYFYKGQIDKIFLCFADPHFKNKYLMNDYAYLLKPGGKIYSITDVENLHNWNVETIENNPCFRKMNEEEYKNDVCVDCMKNTDEAKKVKKINGKMYVAVFERVEVKISTIEDLIKVIK